MAQAEAGGGDPPAPLRWAVVAAGLTKALRVEVGRFPPDRRRPGHGADLPWPSAGQTRQLGRTWPQGVNCSILFFDVPARAGLVASAPISEHAFRIRISLSCLPLSVAPDLSTHAPRCRGSGVTLSGTTTSAR